MIVYFSACGNNRHIANKIAKEIKDNVVAITEIKEINLSEGEAFGIVVPTYFWGLPSIVSEWFDNVQIKCSGNNYVYLVTSFGTTTGAIGAITEKKLKKKGIHLDAKYAVRMPDTWTVWFDLSDKDKVAKQNSLADLKIDKVIKLISNKKKNRFMPNGLPHFCGKMAQIYYQSCRETKHLILEKDACSGCGICERQCPVKAISITDGNAKWTKEQCVMCFGCLHKCPKAAISYDNKTKENGQYQHP